MKKILTIAIFVLHTFLSYSQSKTEFGLTTEGSWFMPHRTDGRDWATKAGFGTGIGVYASRNIFWRFSADIGLEYRYKQMQQHYAAYTGNKGVMIPMLILKVATNSRCIISLCRFISRYS